MLRNIEETLSTSCALHKNREIIYLQGDFCNEKKKKKFLLCAAQDKILDEF